MMDDFFNPTVSEETVAAWLDGTLSADDSAAFLETCATDTDLQNILDANDQVDDYYEDMMETGYELPEELQTDFDLPHIADADDMAFDDDDVEPYDDHSVYDHEDQPTDEQDDDTEYNHDPADTYADMDNGEDFF